MTDKLLTASQLAAKLNVNRTTVWRMVKRGDIKPVKYGSVVRYKDPTK
jgi:excisionase family DNA binding protein